MYAPLLRCTPAPLRSCPCSAAFLCYDWLRTRSRFDKPVRPHMPTTQLTILKKNDLFSFLGLVSGQLVDDGEGAKPVTVVIKLDPREGQPLLKQFETNGEAMRNYEVAINTSVERGWSVVYRGVPLLG